MNFNSFTTAVAYTQFFKKILKVMKLATLILLIALVQASANTFGQKISLNEKNIAIEKVLENITNQSGYHFFYDAKDLSGIKVSIELKNAEIETALNSCFKNREIVFKIIGKNIILKQKEEPQIKEKDVQPVVRATISISGKVADEKGNFLMGVTVRNRNTKKSTATQIDGSFTIAADRGDILVFTFIGYQQQEQKIGKENYYAVMLSAASSALEQVVVVGYGSTKRKDLTGSVSSVNIDEVKDIPFTSIDQALSGKAPGVQVVQADGSPGGVAGIKIRGGTSILGGNDPLYIIDGIQVTPVDRYIKTPGEVVDPIAQSSGDATPAISGGFSRGLSSLAGLNINDIETIDILKDASATAIYGSKAANGVIIITTKKGLNDQKPIFQFNNYTGLSSPVKAKLLNAEEYTMIMKEAAKNLNTDRVAAGLATSATANSILNNPDYLGTANTDWLGLVLRKGITQNTDISVRGGGKGSKYYTSLSYSRQDGVLKGTDFSRLSGKINLDNEINSKFKFVTNIDYGFTTSNITNGVYSQALYAPPTLAPYNPDGTLNTLNRAAIGSSNFYGFQNPLSLLKGINQGKNAAFLGSIALEYKIFKGLTFKSQGSINYNQYRQRNYTPSSTLYSTTSGASDTKGGVGSQGQTENVNYLIENTLSYNKQFNEDHRIDVVAGTSWEQNKINSFQASGQTYPDDLILNNLGSAAVTLPNVASSAQNSLLSFYIRANYAFKDRYLVTITARSDASSKFSTNNRVGYFPSAGLAWRISQESFMKNVSWVDDLKLRASAGYTGTQNIGNYLYRTLYTPVAYGGTNAVIPSQLGNDRLKWESTLQKDAGLDFSLFKSRIVGSVGIYEKKSSGLLFNMPLPSSSSYGNLTSNLADIRNRGLEINLQGDIFRGKAFSWRSDFNISFNRSLVTNLNTDFVDPNHGSVSSSNGQSYILSNTVLRTGLPIGQFVGSQFSGIIQNAEQLAAYKKAFAYYSFYQPYLNIGDAMFVIPASGPLAGFPDGYRLIGTAAPKFYGGYTNTFSYKNFSLSTLLTYSYGGHILYLADIQNQYVSDRTNKNVRILDRWTPENPSDTNPRLIYGQNASGVSDKNIYSSSYIKLKSISLNYKFSKSLMDKLNIQTASVYVSATNLFSITKYPGQDPEVSNDPYSLIDGYTDSNAYPAVKQFIMGIRLGF